MTDILIRLRSPRRPQFAARASLRATGVLGASLVLALPLAAQQATDSTAHAPKPAAEPIPPKFIHVPGTSINFSIGGYAKLDAIQDFDPMGDRYQFRMRTVPVGSAQNSQSGETTLHARESRLTFDLRSGEGPERMRVFAETDFYGDNNTLRLRQVFGEYGHFLAGQTWTTFMDITVRPRSLDYEGPEGELYVRQAMIRWTQPMGKNWRWALAAENPNSSFNIPSKLTGTIRNTMPDIPGFIRYETDRGHFQLAGIVHQIRYDGGNGESDVSTMGWGLSATGRLKTTQTDALMGQAGFGKGSASYFDVFSGQKLDAIFTTAGTLVPVGTRGGLVAYEHNWTPKVRSLLGYSRAQLSADTRLAPDALRIIQDVRTNVVYSATRLVDYGAEVLWGRRENQNGGTADAVRLQLSFIYHLN